MEVYFMCAVIMFVGALLVGNNFYITTITIIAPHSADVTDVLYNY